MKKINTIIAVAGGTASGKTTISNKIMKAMKNKSIAFFAIDNYYKDFSHLSHEERKKINYDHPNSIDIPLLVEHLETLSHNESVKQYVYDFKKNVRTKERIIVNPAKVIVIEGILVLAIEEIRNLSDIKIFINLDDDIRFIRRLKRDIEERKRSVERVIEQYLNVVKPMHDLFVEPSKKYADIIIPYYEGNIVAIDVIVSKIKLLIKLKK